MQVQCNTFAGFAADEIETMVKIPRAINFHFAPNCGCSELNTHKCEYCALLAQMSNTRNRTLTLTTASAPAPAPAQHITSSHCCMTKLCVSVCECADEGSPWCGKFILRYHNLAIIYCVYNININKYVSRNHGWKIKNGQR